MSTTGFSKFNYYEQALINNLRGTAPTAVATPYLGLSIAATLSAAPSSGQNQIQTATNIPVGSTVQIFPAAGPYTSGDANGPFTVSATSGAGPYTLTLSANLAANHSIGDYISYSPIDSGGGVNEISGNAYARQAVTFGAPAANGSGSTTGSKSVISAQISFPTATGTWGLVCWAVVFDALTAGNKLLYGQLTTPQLIGSGNQLIFPASTGLSYTED